MKAIRIHNSGIPDVLQYEDIPVPEPAATALVKVAAIGVHFIDVYHRKGWSEVARTTFRPGMEASGKVLAVGTGV